MKLIRTLLCVCLLAGCERSIEQQDNQQPPTEDPLTVPSPTVDRLPPCMPQPAALGEVWLAYLSEGGRNCALDHLQMLSGEGPSERQLIYQDVRETSGDSTIVWRISAGGSRTRLAEYRRDSAGRIVEHSVIQGPSSKATYRFRYDAEGRILERSFESGNGVGSTIRQTFDGGRLIRRTTEDFRPNRATHRVTIDWRYDAEDRLISASATVDDKPAVQRLSWSYDAAGRPSRAQLAIDERGSSEMHWVWSEQGELLSHVAQWSAGQPAVSEVLDDYSPLRSRALPHVDLHIDLDRQLDALRAGRQCQPLPMAGSSDYRSSDYDLIWPREEPEPLNTVKPSDDIESRYQHGYTSDAYYYVPPNYHGHGGLGRSWLNEVEVTFGARLESSYRDGRLVAQQIQFQRRNTVGPASFTRELHYDDGRLVEDIVRESDSQRRRELALRFVRDSAGRLLSRERWVDGQRIDHFSWKRATDGLAIEHIASLAATSTDLPGGPQPNEQRMVTLAKLQREFDSAGRLIREVHRHGEAFSGMGQGVIHLFAYQGRRLTDWIRQSIDNGSQTVRRYDESGRSTFIGTRPTEQSDWVYFRAFAYADNDLASRVQSGPSQPRLILASYSCQE